MPSEVKLVPKENQGQCSQDRHLVKWVDKASGHLALPIIAVHEGN